MSKKYPAKETKEEPYELVMKVWQRFKRNIR